MKINFGGKEVEIKELTIGDTVELEKKYGIILTKLAQEQKPQDILNFLFFVLKKSIPDITLEETGSIPLNSPELIKIMKIAAGTFKEEEEGKVPLEN